MAESGGDACPLRMTSTSLSWTATDSSGLVPLLCCCFSKPCAVAASRRKMRRVCSVHDSMARSLAQWAAWLSH